MQFNVEVVSERFYIREEPEEPVSMTVVEDFLKSIPFQVKF